MICEYFDNFTKEFSVDLDRHEIKNRIEKARIRARKEMLSCKKAHVLFSIVKYSEDDEIKSVQIHRNTHLTDDELDEVVSKNKNSYFDVLHKESCQKACETLVKREKQREIRPLTLKEANAFINKYHRHHNGTVGCKFSIGLYEEEKLIGAAICGRPVSRYLDNGKICEINRLCVIKDKHNACSMLYGACSRIAREMGYKKIVTYILQSESGTSLKASNFICEGIAGGTHWTGKRNRNQNIPQEMKTRWTKKLA